MDFKIYLFPFFAVVIGFIIAFFFQPKSKKQIKLLLAFSGSFLLALTLMHLLPNVYYQELKGILDTSHIHSHTGLYILFGIIFQIILEYFSKGAEHGHVHGHDKIYHIPWLMFFSLCLHALFEGIPINNEPHLAIGIAIHHLPIAMILTLFFKNAQLNNIAIALFMVVFAMMTPLGTLMASQLTVIKDYQNQLLGFVIGILFHISSTIIFESNEGHKFNITKLIAIVLGIVLASLM